MSEPIKPVEAITEPVVVTVQPEVKKKITKVIDDQPLDELKREIERLTGVVKVKDEELVKAIELSKTQEIALKAIDIQKNSKTELSLLEIVHRILHPYYYENPFEFMTGKKKE